MRTKKIITKKQSNIPNFILKDIKKIDKIYSAHYKNYTLSNHFKKTSLLNFILSLSTHDVEYAMHRAIEKIPNKKNQTIKYFCGVCWNLINSPDLHLSSRANFVSVKKQKRKK